MRKLVVTSLVALIPALVLAGNAHFVGAPQISTSDSEALITGKVAGLGNVPQIHVTASATAQCINNGDNHPHAGNKETFSAEGDFPVQNGKALFALTLTATFQPDCAPPMVVSWADLMVTVTAEDGTFLQFP